MFGRLRGKFQTIRFLFSRHPVSYVGYTNRFNFGDDLLLDVYRYFAGRNVIATVDIPPFFLGLRSNVDVVLGGGTIINGNMYLRALKSHRSPRFRMTFFSGVRPPPLEDGWSRLLRSFEQVSVRSEQSRDYLREVTEDIGVGVDPGVYAPKVYPAQRSGVDGSRPYIVVNVHHSGELATYLTCNLEFFDHLRDHFQIVFLVVSPTDISVTTPLITTSDTLKLGFLSVKKALDIVAGASFVISERLHVGVAAVAYQVPVAAFEYEGKCREFFDSVGLADCVFNSVDELVSRVEGVVADTGRATVADLTELSPTPLPKNV